ncbi:putative kinase-like protein [Rosellinia necatrix]|uniref:Putative kinase-like protein n=1 Tax=Rosellinia necatrix TaxID=77044 RepID=A0A1W2TPQ8_ROSNE|nr:putative kinase-like protein [Rosellinia necatrix]
MDNSEENQQQAQSPLHDSLFGGDSDRESNLEESARSPSRVADQHDAINTVDALIIPPLQSLGDDQARVSNWEKDNPYLYSTWVTEPTIMSIVTTLKEAIGTDKEYTVQFLHDGVFSKLYDVSFDNQAFIMRISLPVWRHAKTESEVATLDWVGRYTSLRVPRVRAYDSLGNGPLGFEWILMTKLEGKPLFECWESVSMGLKERLVKQIAVFSASTFNQPFHGGIGSIYQPCMTNIDEVAPNPNASIHAVGEAVSMALFQGYRALLDYSRGPYFRISDWMESRLRFASSNLMKRLDYATDNSEVGTLHQLLELTRNVKGLVPKFITSSTTLSTILCHDALSLDNIFVNEDGIFMGVVDWQCIVCVPPHEACQFPAFLQQKFDRFRDPIRAYYLTDEAYSRELRRYEVTQLRKIYIEEMIDRAPGFVDIWRESANLRDYEAAVQNCDNEFTMKRVEKWVNAMENGGDPAEMPKRLHEQLME